MTLIVRNGERGERGYPGNVHIGSDTPPPGAVIWLNPDGTPDVPGIGAGIPDGGKAGQILRKKSDEDYDTEWADFEIPEQYGLVTYDQNKTITIS